MGTSALREDAAVPAGPVSVAALAWRFRGVVRVTAIAKATFAFAHDAAMPRGEPEPIVHAEVHHDNSPARSVRLTTDLAPYLGRADVLLTGSAYAPRGVFVETLPVRLGLFDGARPILDKTVLVRQMGGIKKVPLVYERAYGGIGWRDNPFGVGAMTGSGQPGILDPFDDKRLAGFGPIGQGWPARKRLLGGTPRKALESEDIVEIPDAFDWEYFQAALPDQRIGFLRGDEWIVMDGLHPKHARVRMRLPGARGLALVCGLGPWGVPDGQPIALHADTLRIDGDEERCSVTFRATFPVADEAALASVRVVLGVELPGQPIAWPDLASLVATRGAPAPPSSGSMVISEEDFESVRGDVLMGTMAVEFDSPQPAPAAPHPSERPPREPALDTLESTMWSEPEPPKRPTLPFQGAGQTSALRQASPPRRQPHADNPLSGTLAQTPDDQERAGQRTALPFGEKPPSVAPPPAPTAAPTEPARQEAAVRSTTSPWAAAPEPAPAAPAPAAPPSPMGPPAVSSNVKKGLYGRFGGKR